MKKSDYKLVKEALAENIKLSDTNNKFWSYQLDSFTDKFDINLHSINYNQVKACMRKIEKHLTSKYELTWHEKITNPNSLSGHNSGNKLRTYKTFKENFAIEKYLMNTDNIDHRRSISKIRLSSHPLYKHRESKGDSSRST